MSPGPPGSSAQEAAARRRRGKGNALPGGSARSSLRTLRTNVFSSDNSVLSAIGAALPALGRWNDTFISVRRTRRPT